MGRVRGVRGAITTMVLTTGLLAVPSATSVASAPADQHWVATWTASPTDSAVPIDASGLPVPEMLTDQTLRMIVTPHAAGSVLRIHLSNRFGEQPTTFGHVTIGIAGTNAVSAVTPVTFDGEEAVTVPAGDDVMSDPVSLQFAAFTKLAVSMYMPGIQAFPTKHWNANATSLYSPPASGDLSATSSDAGFSLQTEAWLYVDDIDVEAPVTTGSIVAFGDSITDGFVAATPLSEPVSLAVADKDGRYPDDLQRRLDAAGIPLSMANEGIGSNRLVTDGEPLMLGLSGVQRFQEDALDVPGVTGVLLQEGINDFGLPPQTTTPADLIAGYEKVIAMAHADGVKIWLGTLLPASNAFFDGTITAPNSELYREQVNGWIRTQHLADGVVDFDAALRDPSDPHVLNPAYSGPDHLHPNLAGYQVMADTVSLSMLESSL